jgi:hypothetical protein
MGVVPFAPIGSANKTVAVVAKSKGLGGESALPLAMAITRRPSFTVQELRKAIDALRTTANLPHTWTDYSPPTGFVLASDQTAMRTALDQAVFAITGQHVAFTGTVPANGVVISAYHMTQLRSGVK